MTSSEEDVCHYYAKVQNLKRLCRKKRRISKTRTHCCCFSCRKSMASLHNHDNILYSILKFCYVVESDTCYIYIFPPTVNITKFGNSINEY